MIPLIIVLSLPTFQPQTAATPGKAPSAVTGSKTVDGAQTALRDDGYGTCPAFQHSHDSDPGKCFDNDDHVVSDDSVGRKVLPVPK